jgi:hypothetical protein
MKHLAYIDGDGKVQCESLQKEIHLMKQKGVKQLVFTVEEFRQKRSSPQNRYYHGVVVELIYRGMQDAGIDRLYDHGPMLTKDRTHDYLKDMFLKAPGPFGEITRSTTELNTQEFGEYIERCVQFAAEYLNVVIPPPGEQMSLIEQEQAA